MDDLCIVQGFKSKMWPLASYDKDAICYLAKKNDLVATCNSSSICKDDVHHNEYYIRVVYFENTIKNIICNNMYLIIRKDYNSFSTYDLEYFGYAKDIEEYFSLCKNSAFGCSSYAYPNEIHLVKLCNISPEELLIYRDMRKDIA